MNGIKLEPVKNLLRRIEHVVSAIEHVLVNECNVVVHVHWDRLQASQSDGRRDEDWGSCSTVSVFIW